jgi:hypothetical protein
MLDLPRKIIEVYYTSSRKRRKRYIGAWRSLASALQWGCRGPGFKSRRPDFFETIFCRWVLL